MPNDTENNGSSTLLSSITRLLDSNISAGSGLDSLITVLSLLCLISIVSRNQTVSQPSQLQSASNNSNPLHKLLGDLTKGGSNDGGGLSSDSLMSLLPLLNSPQLKSKLNPSTIGSVLGLLNNMGGLGSNSLQDKSKSEIKAENKAEEPKSSKEPEPPVQPAATVQQTVPIARQNPSSQDNETPEEPEGKNYGRYLNWKNNF